jgi:hypothetical protein
MSRFRATEFLSVAALLAGLALVAVPAAPARPGVHVSPTLSAVEEADRSATSSRTGSAVRRAQEERAAVLEWGPDPFRPRTGPARPVATPVLTGISLREGERWAIIDRQIVREGTVLGSGATVACIERASVTLRKDEKEWTLVLGEQR